MNRMIIVLSCLLLASCMQGGQEDFFSVIPHPAQVSIHEGFFNVAGEDFYVAEDAAQAGNVAALVQGFASQLSLVTGKQSDMVADSLGAGVRFSLDAGLPAEGYMLAVSENGVRVAAGDYNGFFYAVQTLMQMLPAEIYGKEKARGRWVLPYADITDAPRFPYRGLLLDPARYFYTVEQTKRVIDAMALYKLNRLHWHLTDDQGWRWEVKKYPKLTETGAWRDGSCTRNYIESYDNVPHGGFYTQDQLREVVAYAAARGIEIIPELDLPGHMVAALTAYPEFGCTGGPYEVYRLWGVTKDLLCAGKDEVFDFIEDLLDELVEIFPSEYVHIGGDECPRERWSECTACQARIRQLGLRDADGVSAEARLQNYVMERVQKMLQERGRKVACWNEAIEGDLNTDITVFAWCDGILGSEPGAEPASRGYETVLCNIDDLYFIWPQNPDVESEPFTPYRRITLPTMRVYEYEPLAEIRSGSEQFVKGVQGHVWGSYVPDGEIMEYTMLPRLCALSEVQWCMAENKDPERFRRSMEHSFRILDELGYNYCPCLDENPERERYKGTYRNYDNDAEVIDKPAPKGFEPFYVSHMGRYGLSYDDGSEYEVVERLLAGASLTPLGAKIKAKFDEVYPLVKGYKAELAPAGRDQMRLLAGRMVKAFPGIFGGECDVLVSSSGDLRCQQSKECFTEALMACGPKVEAKYDEDPYQAMMLERKPLKPIDRDKALYDFSNPDMLYRRLFADPQAAKKLADVPDFVRALYHFGLYLESIGVEDDVIESAFTDEMASALAFVDDYCYSNNCGWSTKENAAASWPMLESIVMTADKDIASGDVDARLRFGNEETIMSLMSLLKTGAFSERVFDCDNVTMSANIRWVFAKNKTGDVMVKLQYNESDRTEWMPWDEFRDFCLEQIRQAKEKLPRLIWNEGHPDRKTGMAVHELLICNAPQGLEWDLWGHFYDGCKLPCKAVKGSMAQMYMYSGSCWRVEPEVAADTVVLRYADMRRKHSWAPRGFYIKMRESGMVIPVDIECNRIPYEKTVYPEYPHVDLRLTDIVPSVKDVRIGEGESRIKKTEEVKVDGIRPEGYRLTVGNGKALVEASDAQGLRYGRITLEKFMENAGSDILPDMVVEDWPDLACRALMIDVSRIYYPVEELKKLVDVLERCKMNTLTLHVNDDENWRLEIDGLPELTSFGAFHDIPVRQADGSYLCANAVPPVKGSALGKVWEGTSGYYSHAEFVDFLRYAWAHGVTVIPDVDVPGHNHAAIEAMKYRERTTGDASCRLVDPQDRSVYCSVQGYSGNVIDIALPSVLNFLGKVYDSIISMYAEAGVPLQEICIGGDEVAEGAWEKSPACIAAMKENGFANLHELRCDFVRKVNGLLRERGVRMSGYHEVIEGISDELFEEIKENCGRIWVWKLLESAEDASMLYDLANRGMNVLIELPSHMNYDNARSMGWDDRGLDWAGTLDEIKAFSLLPFKYESSRRFDNYGKPCDITVFSSHVPELKCPERITGTIGMLWGDNLWQSHDAFGMLFPKAYSSWERNWNAHPEWEQSSDAEDPVFMEDFIHFFTIVREREIPYLDKMGLNYWNKKN